MINISKAAGFLFIIFSAVGILIVPRIAQGAESVNVGVIHWEGFTYSKMMRNSHQMALEMINDEGGIQGKPLKLMYADDQGQRTAGEQAVQDLALEKGAVMLVGGYGSSNTIYMAAMAEKINKPFLISTAADDRITQQDWKNIYRMNPPAQEYAKGVEELLLKKIKPKSLSIIYENSPYGTDSALQMMWFCREHDIEVKKIIPYHKERRGQEYYHKLIAPLQEDNPDVIYMVSYLEDAALIVKNIRELNIKSTLIGGAGGFTSHKFIEMMGDDAENILTATLWTSTLPYYGTQEYYDTYRTRYGVPPDYHGAEAYSSVMVAADVLRRADSFSPEDIRDALNNTDMKTAFGPVFFKNYGKFRRQNSIPTMVLQVINNRYECVWPGSIATAKLSLQQQ
jgi:branched-chain amino acid transport system substrate-binding protein